MRNGALGRRIEGGGGDGEPELDLEAHEVERSRRDLAGSRYVRSPVNERLGLAVRANSFPATGACDAYPVPVRWTKKILFPSGPTGRREKPASRRADSR